MTVFICFVWLHLHHFLTFRKIKLSDRNLIRSNFESTSLMKFASLLKKYFWLVALNHHFRNQNTLFRNHQWWSIFQRICKLIIRLCVLTSFDKKTVLIWYFIIYHLRWFIWIVLPRNKQTLKISHVFKFNNFPSKSSRILRALFTSLLYKQ